MNTQAIAFTASEQTLTKTSGADYYASNTIGYIEAAFDLDTNWGGFDSVRAVWKSQYYTISAVLDAYGKCLVPAEVKYYKSKVFVNLVGSNVENNVLVDRLTTYPILAFTIDAEAEVEGTETTDITPSQFEQFVNQVEGYADAAADSADDAAAAVASLAPAYSSSSTYAVGDYVMHEGVMYECTTAITTAEAWNAAHWTAVAIATEISDLKEEISDKPNWTVGSAEQLVSDEASATDVTPYTFRRSGGGLIPFNFTREELSKVVGGTVAWNQLVQNGNFADTTKWNATRVTLSASGNVGTFTASSDSDNYIQQAVSFPQNHKIFYTIDYKANTARQTAYEMVVVFKGTTSDRTGVQGGTDTNWHTSAGVFVCSAETYRAIRLRCPFTDATTSFRNVFATDLTAMFGSTIADYIYSLEQANAGAGVAWFKKLFPKPYYAYNAGELMSVQVASHEMVGFNQWDEEWELGTLDNSGNDYASSTRIRSKGYTPVLPSTTYYLKSSLSTQLFFYDANKVFISAQFKSDATFTTPQNACYLRFAFNANYGTTYKNDICINLSHNGSRNGEYEPYEKHSYELDANLTLRGIPKLDASNNLYYDGDEYESDGSVNRRYGVVDLGTLNWTYVSDQSGFYVFLNKMKTGQTYAPIICAKYANAPLMGWANLSDKQISTNASGNTNNAQIIVKDSSYTDAASFKTAMSGIYLVYELATPTTETADPYTAVQICDSDGTEEFVDALVESGDRDVAIPVGTETTYFEDMAGKLAELPPIPSAPSANGTYTLQAVVSSGTVTYQWTS